MPPFAKRIRDPMYGDVGLTTDELRIIDTRQFQDLRGIRQLGLAYLVYPSAHHTRFEHALGTLYMAQKIMRGIKNADYLREGGPGEHVVRLAALVHDVSHVPFGHSIEDDLKLWGRHDTTARVESSLSPETRGDDPRMTYRFSRGGASRMPSGGEGPGRLPCYEGHLS